MRIAVIAAMTQKGVIGSHNQIPWHIPEELHYFRKMTLGKPLIMGRKTFESLGCKPLPKRQNIVLTQSKNFAEIEGIVVVSSVEAALASVKDSAEVMVIGGAKIYEAFLPLASRLYLSFIAGDYEGDTFFPEINWQAWQMIEEQKQDLFTTTIWERKNGHV